MSLLKANQHIKLNLYYILKTNSLGAITVDVLKDDEAEKMKKENEEKEAAFNEEHANDENMKFSLPEDRAVQCLVTEWKVLSWRSHKDITKRSLFKDPMDNSRDVDWLEYRDGRLKECIVGWDLKDEKGNTVPFSIQALEQLPFEVVATLLDKYDRATSLGDEEEKK